MALGLNHPHNDQVSQIVSHCAWNWCEFICAKSFVEVGALVLEIEMLPAQTWVQRSGVSDLSSASRHPTRGCTGRLGSEPAPSSAASQGCRLGSPAQGLAPHLGDAEGSEM